MGKKGAKDHPNIQLKLLNKLHYNYRSPKHHSIPSPRLLLNFLIRSEGGGGDPLYNFLEGLFR